MKIISGLLGVAMLTLLTSPLHATQFYAAKVTKSDIAGIQDLDNLDEVIRTYASQNGLSAYFKPKNKNEDGHLRLGNDEALIISGGKGSVVKELNQYIDRDIHNSSMQLTYNVEAYGCYKKSRFIGKANTYVMVMGNNAGWNNGWCTGTWTRLTNAGAYVRVSDLHRRVTTIEKN